MTSSVSMTRVNCPLPGRAAASAAPDGALAEPESYPLMNTNRRQSRSGVLRELREFTRIEPSESASIRVNSRLKTPTPPKFSDQSKPLAPASHEVVSQP